MRPTLPFLAFTLLLALASIGRADEADDAATRYHEAYALEVIEGDVKGAARGYLALMEDERVPPQLRAESRFRFAICAALLGRADEARVRLSALIADDTMPARLKAKARTYLASIAGLGAGSELERKLQSLVFDLGRLEPNGNVPAYRDFEIIGDAALPFLEKLLTHPDVRLRLHAFRLLCRMGQPGMGDRWRPDIGLVGGWFGQDVGTYVNARPNELAAMERRLMSLGEEELAQALRPVATLSGGPSFTLGFLEDTALREAPRDHALSLLRNSSDVAGVRALVEGWLRGTDEALRDRVLRWILGGGGVSPQPVSPELYRLAVDYVTRHGPRGRRGFRDLTRVQPTSVLLDALEVFVEAGNHDLLTQGAADSVADVLDSRPPEEVDWRRYAELLKRWTRAYPAAAAAEPNLGYPPHSFPLHPEAALAHLPDDESNALALWILDEATRQSKTAVGEDAWSYLFALRPDSPASMAQLVRVMRATDDPALRARLFEMLPLRDAQASAEMKQALVEALALLLPLLDDEQLGEAATALPRSADTYSHWIVQMFLEALVARPESVRYRVMASWFDVAGHRVVTVAAFIAGPVLGAVRGLWDTLPTEDRERWIRDTWRLTRYDLVRGSGRYADLLAFLGEHLGEPGTDWNSVAQRPDTFPLTLWVPLAPTEAVNGIVHTHRQGEVLHSEASVDAAAHALTKDPAKVNAAVLLLAGGKTSPGVGTAIYDRLLAAAPRSVRSLVISMLDRRTGKPASMEGLAGALEVLLVEDEPNLDDLQVVAEILAREAPSKRLVDAGLLLLADRERRDHLLAGIRIAAALAQPEFKATLHDLYVDTLDSRVRDAARKALDTIEEMGRARSGLPPR